MGQTEIKQLDQILSNPDNAEFARAWQRWRGGRLVPHRSDVELRDIARMLDRVALFEIRGPDEIIIRLAGTSLRDIVDFELTGRNFRDFTAPADWPERRSRMQTMSSLPCGGRMTFRQIQPSGRTMEFEAITLPLDPPEPGRPRLLCSCSSLIARTFQDPPQQPQQIVPVAHAFAYVDIGAGIPDLPG